MQIHELNNFTGTLGSGAYLAVDDGTDTGKLSTQQLLAATEARIDNIIAGPAPSAEEIVDARLGDDGVTYPSLGDAIRDQVGDLKSELNGLVISNNVKQNFIAGSYIKLNLDYGETQGEIVDFTPLENGSFAYQIIPCKKGDTFTVTGTGASAPRLWGFTDTNRKLLIVEGANMARENYVVTATKDGYFISNINVSYPYDLVYTHLFNANNYTELKNEITTVDEKTDALQSDFDNYFSIDASLDIDGYIDSSGEVVWHNDYACTDFIQVTSNGMFVPIEYRVKAINAVKIGLYDADKNFIMAVDATDSSSLTEVTGILNYVDGAVYARFSSAWRNYDGFYLKYSSIRNQLASAERDNVYCNYDGNEISMFRKGLCIGDSLTQGTLNYYEDGSTAHYTSREGINYPTYLNKLTGVDITNMGNAGYTSVDWWNIHQNDDLSGYDFAIIQLGVNDTGHYGGWNSATETAFTNIINKLKTQNSKIKIFVANIIPAISYSDADYLAMSQAISGFVTGLSDEQVILLDMQTHGHTRDSEAYNCGHLSAYGYWRLAQDYKNYIGYYISTHKMQFREVQFIGTNYYYSN